jgi:hypothetical protein
MCERDGVMNTKTTDKPKRKPLRAFQAWPENEQRLAAAARLRINISELVNEALSAKLDSLLNKRMKAIQREIKMVRGAGIEPATPTVSR